MPTATGRAALMSRADTISPMQANGTATLTAGDISGLRENAQKSQYRRVEGRRVPVRFNGGPLDGIKITVLTHDAVGA